MRRTPRSRSSWIVSALYQATDTAGELTVVVEVRGERLHPPAVAITRIDLSDPPVATWSGVHTGGDGHYLSLDTREDELGYVGADYAAVLEHRADTLGAPS